MIRISDRVQNVKPSPTLAADAKAKALIRAGEDIVNLGAGEPDFDTPEIAKEGGIEAIRAGVTKYGPVPGLPELRQAVVDSLKQDQGLDYTPDDVLVSVGAKHSLYNFFQAVINPGDEVVLPAPYWVSYPEMVTLAGGKTVVVPTDHQSDFVPDPKAIEAAITDRTRVLVINSPQNPTGAGYPREVVEAITKIGVERDLILCSDEIYRKLTYGGFQPVSPAELSDEARARTVVFNGVSKSYAMTGWRVGWAAGPREIIKAMTTIQSQSTSGIPGIMQHGALAALKAPQSVVDDMVAAFSRRARLVVDRLNAMSGVDCPEPRGAFYVFPHIGSLFGKKTPQGKIIEGSLQMQEYLLDAGKVALVAGAPFGADEHLRISFAASQENLEKAMDRIEKALGELS
jgi:aspartate aminotransferase